jgi:hypothetical protein
MASQKDSKSGQALLSSPTAGQLFTTFAAISLSGFGGVLAWARRILVAQRRWLTAEQFNDQPRPRPGHARPHRGERQRDRQYR